MLLGSLIARNLQRKFDNLPNWREVVQEAAAEIDSDFGAEVKKRIFYQVHMGEWAYATVKEFAYILVDLSKNPDFKGSVDSFLKFIDEELDDAPPKAERINARGMILSKFGDCPPAHLSALQTLYRSYKENQQEDKSVLQNELGKLGID